MAKKSVAKWKMLRIFDTSFIVACAFVSVMHIDRVCCPLPVKKVSLCLHYQIHYELSGCWIQIQDAAFEITSS